MLSYARGPETPLIESTIPKAFSATVGRFPDREALIVPHQEVRLTWGELAKAVGNVAGNLAALGVRPGDRIGIWSANCVEWILLQLATAQARLVLINVNPAYRSHELRYVLGQSGMRAIFLWETDERGDYSRILEEAREGQSIDLRHLVYFGSESWRSILQPCPAPASTQADPHEVVNIQYTSGTTGAPKGVLLTHHNLINNAAAIASRFQATEQDRICVPVPLYHCFGCVIGAMTWIVTGAAMILPAARFD